MSYDSYYDQANSNNTPELDKKLTETNLKLEKAIRILKNINTANLTEGRMDEVIILSKYIKELETK